MTGLTQDEAFARIRLLRSANIGPVTYRQLIARFGIAAKAIEALPDLAAVMLLRIRKDGAGQ